MYIFKYSNANLKKIEGFTIYFRNFQVNLIKKTRQVIGQISNPS